jgi:hypothetical protein
MNKRPMAMTQVKKSSMKLMKVPKMGASIEKKKQEMFAKFQNLKKKKGA